MRVDSSLGCDFIACKRHAYHLKFSTKSVGFALFPRKKVDLNSSVLLANKYM